MQEELSAQKLPDLDKGAAEIIDTACGLFYGSSVTQSQE